MTSTQDLQRQSLIFYQTKEGSLLSPPNTLSLIVHEASNHPSWIITGIVQQAISTNGECFLAPNSPHRLKTSSKTILHSFTNTEQSYSKHINKYITKNKDQFKFHSYLTSGENLELWHTKLLDQLRKESNPFLILENPELLLSIIPGMTLPRLLSQLQDLQKHSSLYIVTSTSNNLFLSALLHRSSLIVSLTSLTTGRADDMSGTLSVSKGPACSISNLENPNVTDSEYSYLVSTNNINIFYK